MDHMAIQEEQLIKAYLPSSFFHFTLHTLIADLNFFQVKITNRYIHALKLKGGETWENKNNGLLPCLHYSTQLHPYNALEKLKPLVFEHLH